MNFHPTRKLKKQKDPSTKNSLGKVGIDIIMKFQTKKNNT